MNVEPIGVIHSPFTRPGGAPIQASLAGGVEGTVELFERFAAGLKDLDGFERIWLLYWFDRASEARLTVTPYMDKSERGLFATRAPCRPNPIGISSVLLLGIERNILRIADVDVLDGTPLLDIKPYAPRFDHFQISRSGWLDKAGGSGIADDRFVGNEPQ